MIIIEGNHDINQDDEKTITFESKRTKAVMRRLMQNINEHIDPEATCQVVKLEDLRHLK